MIRFSDGQITYLVHHITHSEVRASTAFVLITCGTFLNSAFTFAFVDSSQCASAALSGVSRSFDTVSDQIRFWRSIVVELLG